MRAIQRIFIAIGVTCIILAIFLPTILDALVPPLIGWRDDDIKPENWNWAWVSSSGTNSSAYLFTSDGSVGVIGINFDNATQQVGGISRKIPSVSLSHCRYLDVRAKLDYTLEIGQCNGTHWSYQYLYQSREWNIFTIDLWNPGGAQGASLRLKGEITNIGFKIGDGGWYASPLTSGWKYVKIDYAALRRTTSIEEENAKKLFYQILLIGVGICFLGVYFPFPLLKKSQQPTPTFSNWKSMEERP